MTKELEHPFEPQYFYQGYWGIKKFYTNQSYHHVDVGSSIRWVGALAGMTKIDYIDIRNIPIKNIDITMIVGDIKKLPYQDKSLQSISSLHVIEHIGLGRYGDEIDSKGSIKACKELQRVLKKDGNLFISVPCGKERTVENKHRIFNPDTIISYFDELKLIELSGTIDNGQFIENIDKILLLNQNYGCGMFWFKRK